MDDRGRYKATEKMQSSELQLEANQRILRSSEILSNAEKQVQKHSLEIQSRRQRKQHARNDRGCSSISKKITNNDKLNTAIE